MSKRQAEEDEWDLHKDAILDLYINQDKPLKEVMVAMATQGLKRTQVHASRLTISID
jgi:hypothetical protein